MSTSRTRLAVVAVVVSLAATALAQRAGDRVLVDRPSTEDLYLAGQAIEVRAVVEGDVVAAGRTVSIEAPVYGDAMLAAERIRIDEPIGDDLRAAGRVVHIAAPITGHVVAVADTVTITEGVGDWAWLAANRIDVRGSVGSLKAAGDSITIRGEVRGDAELAGETIRLAPGAIVRGDLRWSGENEPEIAGAHIEGRIVPMQTERPDTGLARIIGMFFWILSLTLAVLFLLVLAPRWSAEVAERARTAKWRSVGLGFAVLLGTPIVIALAFLSGVLWIVGLVVLAAYLFALFAGAPAGILAASDLVLDMAGSHGAQSRQRAAAAAFTALAIAALALVPVLGAIVLLVLTAVGIGATVLSLWTARKRPERARPTVSEPAHA